MVQRRTVLPTARIYEHLIKSWVFVYFQNKMNFPRINVKNLLFLPNGRDYAEEMYGVGTDAIGFSRQNRRCAYTMWVHPEIATTGQKTWNRGVQKQAGITAVNFYVVVAKMLVQQ
ncbi:uncharacterized protein LOC118743480 isoform X3 [Rhagoletis pomonella]|uniref:uncharacterized protein LOC118743480 isoform X3 n=1 Tax=Rhagoletis pomonella TaxID=28610 RepID=UPI00177E5444|nr:uncharacterized protein LOC118743480 isoform X3 [Rhagoletis pomonella]